MSKPVKTPRELTENFMDDYISQIERGTTLKDCKLAIDNFFAQSEEYYKKSYSVENMPKVNGEYQCEHIKEKVIRSNCVWCNLTVAEKIIDRLKREITRLKSKPLEPIKRIS